MVKAMSAGIIAIMLNTKTDKPKSVNMCGYKLATNRQNFTEI